MNRSDPLLPGVKHVALKEIEPQLSRLWALEGERQPGVPLVRTLTLNLVCISETTEQMSDLLAAIQGVSIHHPSRIILIVVDRESESDQIQAKVNMACELTGGGNRSLCTEQIVLHTGRNGLEHLNGVILPLLVPDLPTFIWWPGCRLQHLAEIEELLLLADRLLLDSPFAFASGQHLWDYLHIVDGLKDRIKLSDMLWGRLTQSTQQIIYYQNIREYFSRFM